MFKMRREEIIILINKYLAKGLNYIIIIAGIFLLVLAVYGIYLSAVS